MSDDRPDWVSIRAVAWVLDEAPVSADLIPVLIAIARRCDEDGKGSFQSNPTLSLKTGKSDDQVGRDIKKLLADGLIVRSADQSLPGRYGVPAGKWPTVYDVVLTKVGPKPKPASKNPTGRKKAATPCMDATPGMDAGGGIHATPTPCMDATGTPRMEAPQRKPLNNPLNNPSSCSPLINATPADRLNEADLPHVHREALAIIATSLSTTDPDADEADVHAIYRAVLAAAKSPPNSSGYFAAIARNTGFGGYLSKARNQRADHQAANDRDIETQIKNLMRPDAEPCGHGEPGGRSPHPLTGAFLCPHCRAGAPDDSTEISIPRPVAAAIAAYGNAWAAAGRTIDHHMLAHVTEQLTQMHAADLDADFLSSVAAEAGTAGTDLFTSAQRGMDT